MNAIQTKTTKNGYPIHIMQANGKGENLANGKKYWIAYGNGNPRRAIVRSNSLSYIQKKFAKIG